MKIQRSLLIALLLFFPFLILNHPYITFADTFTSNCIIDNVGSAHGNPPDCSGSAAVTQGGNSIINAAKALKQGFDACDNGLAGNGCSVNQGFLNALKSFPQSNINFMTSVVYPSTEITSNSNEICVQCLGFVRDAVALATGKDASTFLGQYNPTTILRGVYNPVTNVMDNNAPATYAGEGLNFVLVTIPAPGDIALTDSGGEANNISQGHIVIVETVEKNTVTGALGTHFTAVESNYTPCTVTNESSGIQHADKLFTFYRLQ